MLGAEGFCVRQTLLAKWRQHMPHATVHEFADCGHYILEDASDEVIAHIKGFMADEQVASASSERAAG